MRRELWAGSVGGLFHFKRAYKRPRGHRAAEKRDELAPRHPSPDFESLRVKGLNIALPGPRDTIDPDFAGIRSSLAAFGIGYIGYRNNSFYNNVLPAERTTFGRQAYNGQKPTFMTNNVMQMTYDLSRYGKSGRSRLRTSITKYLRFGPLKPPYPVALTMTLAYGTVVPAIVKWSSVMKLTPQRLHLKTLTSGSSSTPGIVRARTIGREQLGQIGDWGCIFSTNRPRVSLTS